MDWFGFANKIHVYFAKTVFTVNQLMMEEKRLRQNIMVYLVSNDSLTKSYF
jgi:hypothetical protein